MPDDITNIVILQHMQEMKVSLMQKMSALEQQIVVVDKKIDRTTEEMTKGFEEARQHRQALQEDLEATMRTLSKHDAKLARL